MDTWENKEQTHMDQGFCPALWAHLKVLPLTLLDGQFPLEGFTSQYLHAIYIHRIEFLCFSLQPLVETTHCGEVFCFYCPLKTQQLRPLRSVALDSYYLHHLVQKKVKASREGVSGTCSLLSLSHSHRLHRSGKGLAHTGLADKATGLEWAPYLVLLSSAFQERGLP